MKKQKFIDKHLYDYSKNAGLCHNDKAADEAVTRIKELIKAGDISMGLKQMYRFTPSELQAIIDEICRLQRISCKIEYIIFTDANRIKDAEQPETGIKQ